MVYGLTDFGRDVTRIEARQDFQQDKDRLVGLHIPDKLASIRIGGKNDRGRRQRFCFPGDPHDLQTVFRDLPVVSDRNAAEARHRRFIDNRVEAPFTALMSPSCIAQGPPMPVSGLKPTISTCSLPPSGFRIVLQPKISFSPEATPLTRSARLSFRSGNGCEKSKFLEFLDVIQMSASVLSIIRAQLSMKPRNTPIWPAIRITEKLTPKTATANWVLSCKRFLRAMMSTRGVYPLRCDFPTYFLP